MLGCQSRKGVVIVAGLNLKTAKGKLILAAIVVGSVAVVAAAIVVPVVLTSNKSTAKSAPAVTSDEISRFNEAYNGALTVSGGSITVKANAFADRTDLPKGFTLPPGVTAVAAQAFARAKLPAGFTVPKTVASIAADAFWQTTFDPGYYWGLSAPQPGAVVVSVDQTPAYKAFNAAYPGMLVNYQTIKRGSFQNKTVPAGFTMPPFVTSIDHYAFAKAMVPAGFTLPASLTSIGNYAFRGTTLPVSFALPTAMRAVGMDLQHSALAYIAFSEAVLPAGFTITPTVEQIYSASFNNAAVSRGFAIPATTAVYNYDPFGQGWTTSPDTVLEGIQIPADCR